MRADTNGNAVPGLASSPPSIPSGRVRRASSSLRRASLRVLLFVLLVAFITSLFAGCGLTPGGSGPVPSQAPPAAEQGAASAEGSVKPTKPAQAGRPGRIPTIMATVTEVIDGDTLRAVLASGRKEKVRLIGVDTPESTKKVEPYGKEAAAYTEKRLSGRTVYLELDVGERDKYGRLLAYVWLSKPQSGSEAEVRAKMFNAELLVAGMAQVMTLAPNVKYADLFVKLQREATEAGKGLWAAGAASSPGSGTAAERPAKYIGNANSNEFHRADCEWAAIAAPLPLIWPPSK